MPAPKNQEIRAIVRRERVAVLYLQGWSQRRIGQELHCTQSCVSKDLEVLRKQWLETSLRNFDEAKALELAKLDMIEAEAFEGWQRSCQPGVSVKEKAVKIKDSGLPGVETETTTRHQSGDPNFLKVIQICVDKRCAILGLDAPKKLKDVSEERFKTRDEMLAEVIAKLKPQLAK